MSHQHRAYQPAQGVADVKAAHQIVERQFRLARAALGDQLPAQHAGQQAEDQRRGEQDAVRAIDPKLPAESQDLILLVDVYHEFSHPVHMLKAIRKALKPEGKLVLVEFRAEDPDVPIKPEHKMSKKQVNKELTANGYKLVEEFDKLPWQHMMFFQKDEKAAEKKDEKKE